MEQMPGAPFPSGWWGFDLGSYRPCDGTYQLYPYDSLPPLSEPDHSLSWLGPLDAQVDAEMAAHHQGSQMVNALDALTTQAKSLGLALPSAFTRLMASPSLQDRIPSCTACEFDLASILTPCPGAEDGYIAAFLRDQQYCVLWYLYLTPEGSHRVLSFPGDMQEYLEEAESGGQVTIEQITEAIRDSAPSFASFIHRFWLENIIWFKLNSSNAAPFTAEERAYLDFYAQRRASQN